MIKFLWNPALFLRRFKQYVPFAEAELLYCFTLGFECNIVFLATTTLLALLQKLDGVSAIFCWHN
jgi:hypothetical protein